MNKIQAGFAVAALAAFAAAPALAQTHVQSSQGATVMSSTGVMVTPGAPGVEPRPFSHGGHGDQRPAGAAAAPLETVGTPTAAGRRGTSACCR